MDPKIIIGVPGLWTSQTEIVTSIAQRSGGFIFAGLVLLETATKQGFTLEVYERDPQLQNAFRIGGGGRIPERDLATIGQHRHTLYCSGAGGSVEKARQILRVGVGLLNAGGLAVKVESSGVAHGGERWRELADSENIFDTYTAFVTLIGGKEYFYSCGMHVFGLPDALVSRNLNAPVAAQLLNAFNSYVLAENPALNEGHTFSTAADAPKFRLNKTSCTIYEPSHPFHNPFGMWNLVGL
jgi:hypothetical protein